MDKNRVIYYEDELNDEFSEAKITPIDIDENYVYIHKNLIWKICSLIVNVILFFIKMFFVYFLKNIIFQKKIGCP